VGGRESPVGGAVLLRLRLCELSTLILRMNSVCLLQSVHKRLASMMQRTMAKVIEFHEPTIFRKPLKGASEYQSAKVIEFRRRTRKSA
jgi:hypothetical protein